MKTRLSLLVFVSVLLLASVFPAAAVEAPGVITNGSFEAPLPGSGWSVKNAVGDKRLCNKPNPLPADGVCVFRFKGGPSSTTLKHVVQASGLNIINNLAACQHLGVGVATKWYSIGASALGTKIMLKIKLSRFSSTYTLKMIDKFVDGTPNAWNQLVNGVLLVPEESAVNHISVAVTHVAPTGKVYIDDVNVIYEPFGPSSC